MQETPIVCTLTEADYRDRETAWLKLRPFVRASMVVPGGLTFRFARVTGLQDSLTELVPGGRVLRLDELLDCRLARRGRAVDHIE